ncbi:MAG TPA: hypothetical protein VL486_07890 [Verrucomicrobiae bacterium]|nr:hypothetical protein [Verrucomicrobiae bacterium]
MKTIKLVCFALLVLAVPGARGERFRTDINPALLYYRAFLLTPDLFTADRDYLFTTNWQGQTLPERVGKLIADYDSQLRLVWEAAQQKVPCDWGIDMSPGPDTLLPQLNRARAVARAARLHAMWDLQHGNQVGARDNLLAAFALGRNTSRDDTVIGALVQIAIEGIVYETVAENFGRFSPETLKQLVDGFDAAPARGTMANATATTEAPDHTVWMENRVLELRKEYPGIDAKVLDSLRQHMDDTNIWPRVVKAAGGTSDGFLKLVRDMQPLYPRLARIMTLPLPEYEDQIQKFDAEVRESQNPLAEVFILQLSGARPKEFTIQAMGAMVRAAVEYKLHGESGLKSVMDPFGKGPFGFRRFEFEGVDRGFELKSAYPGRPVYPCVLIFVEKEGAPFYVDGPQERIGHAVKP